MTFLAVKHFEQFQHYKNRTPIWIKLYNSLLDDFAFLSLSDAARSHLMLIWLIASRHENRIPNNRKYIQEAIHASGKVDVEELVAAGFLVVVEDCASTLLAETQDDASTLLADSLQNAIPEKRERREREEKRTTTSSTTGSELVERLPESHRGDILALLDRVPNAQVWAAELASALDGMPGHHPVTAEQLAQAVRDFNGNAEKPNLSRFRGYLRNAGTPPQPRPISCNPRSSGNSRYAAPSETIKATIAGMVARGEAE